jgi:hypothetical protein
MPHWALVGAILWHGEQDPELRDHPDLKEARRLYDAGLIDAASNLLDRDLLNGA